MNYQKIHDSIILRAKNRSLEGYSENHHIIPRCMGGTNDPENLIRLTPEEHFVVHQLLIKIRPGNNSLVLAIVLTGVDGKYTQRNNKVYGWLRRKHAVAISALLKGKKKKPFTQEHRDALSRSHMGKSLSAAHCAAQSAGKKGKPLSEETKAKRPQKGKGKPASEERKLKCSLSQKGRSFTQEHKDAIKLGIKNAKIKNRNLYSLSQ